MEQKNISRWEVVKNTKTMMFFALIYTAVTLGCLIGIVKRTTLVHQIIFIVVSFFLLVHFRRMLAYFGDILQLRIKVFEGKARRLVFGVDYEGKNKPLDYDLYELSMTNGEKFQFPCAHKMLDCDLVEKARFIFLESTYDLVKAEVLEPTQNKKF